MVTPSSTARVLPSRELILTTQNLLRALGYQVETNGELTQSTRTTLSMFQRQEKLEATGSPNEATVLALSTKVAELVKKKCW